MLGNRAFAFDRQIVAAHQLEEFDTIPQLFFALTEFREKSLPDRLFLNNCGVSFFYALTEGLTNSVAYSWEAQHFSPFFGFSLSRIISFSGL